MKINSYLSGMPYAIVVKQTQTLVDVPINWPDVGCHKTPGIRVSLFIALWTNIYCGFILYLLDDKLMELYLYTGCNAAWPSLRPTL